MYLRLSNPASKCPIHPQHICEHLVMAGVTGKSQQSSFVASPPNITSAILQKRNRSVLIPHQTGPLCLKLSMKNHEIQISPGKPCNQRLTAKLSKKVWQIQEFNSHLPELADSKVYREDFLPLMAINIHLKFIFCLG